MIRQLCNRCLNCQSFKKRSVTDSAAETQKSGNKPHSSTQVLPLSEYFLNKNNKHSNVNGCWQVRLCVHTYMSSKRLCLSKMNLHWRFVLHAKAARVRDLRLGPTEAERRGHICVGAEPDLPASLTIYLIFSRIRSDHVCPRNSTSPKN